MSLFGIPSYFLLYCYQSTVLRHFMYVIILLHSVILFICMFLSTIHYHTIIYIAVHLSYSTMCVPIVLPHSITYLSNCHLFYRILSYVYPSAVFLPHCIMLVCLCHCIISHYVVYAAINRHSAYLVNAFHYLYIFYYNSILYLFTVFHRIFRMPPSFTLGCCNIVYREKHLFQCLEH